MKLAAKPNRAGALGVLLLATLATPVQASDFTLSPVFVSPTNRWGVSINGGAVQLNPHLTLIRGQTYTFDVSGLVGIHSFYIKTASSIGSVNAYVGGGLSGNGIMADGTITFTVPQTAPNTLFYNCGTHASMAGTITIDGLFHYGFETLPAM